DLTDRLHRPVGKKRPAKKAQHQDRDSHRDEVAAKWLENELATVRAPAYLQDRSIAKLHLRESEVSLFIFRNPQPDDPARHAELHRRQLKLNPIFGRGEDERIVIGPDDADKK